MKFAKVVFLVAGIYGLIVLLPMYFLEVQTGRDYPPPIIHPEYYYGFIGVGVAWQLAFLVISRHPVPLSDKLMRGKFFQRGVDFGDVVRRRIEGDIN